MNEYKIAIATNDGKTVSNHFGPTKEYLVVTVADGIVIHTETREKYNHHRGSHDEGEHHHNLDHEHHHDHNHGTGRGLHHHDHDDDDHEHGHHHDKHHHNRMIENILDCQYMLVKSMGFPVHDALEAENIKPILTNIKKIDDAVAAVIDGTIDNNTQYLH